MTEEKEPYKDEYDPQIDYIVGSILMMYIRKNIDNFETVLIDENELPTDMNLMSKAIADIEPIIKDISTSKLRGSKFFYLSRWWEDWGGRNPDFAIRAEDGSNQHPAMVVLREEVVPKILGFKFLTWYMMENENFGYPYFLDPDFIDLSGGEPTSLATIWNTSHAFMTLKEFKDNIKHEYEGDFTEFNV